MVTSPRYQSSGRLRTGTRNLVPGALAMSDREALAAPMTINDSVGTGQLQPCTVSVAGLYDITAVGSQGCRPFLDSIARRYVVDVFLCEE